MVRIFAILILSSLTFFARAQESTKPPKPLNSISLSTEIAKKLVENSHIRMKGLCFWLTTDFPPKIISSPAISQFIPDLVVTVSNNPGENPLVELKAILENKTALKGYQAFYKKTTGSPLGFGNDSSIVTPAHLNEGRTRIVTVIGGPGIYILPGLTHNPETRYFTLHYSSLVDAVMDRSEVAELAYMAFHPLLLLPGHEIGSSINYWGFELPRSMHVTQPSPFRASVVAALHAADIVTNSQGLHLSYPTSNSCGPHCVISNVIYDGKQENIIWQEVYPLNRNILPGDKNDSGVEDNKKGNGNYVFVVWRKYNGCVKQKGHLVTGVHVGEPQKR